MTRKKSLDADVRSSLSCRIAKAQQLFPCVRVELWSDAGGKQRLFLRGKTELLSLHRIIERLNAQTIARHKQRALLSVPNRKRKHTVKPCKRGRPFGCKEFQKNFRICVRMKTVATPLEQRA